jgi:ferrous iron transport protein A
VDAPHELIPLGQLLAGQAGRIEAVLGLPDLIHRLRELGLRDGVQVRMIQPGSPCIIGLAGQRLCFRADEVASVLVKLGVAA